MGYLDRFSLNGKIAVVTGSSRGIGNATAKGLCEAGATVVFTATTLEAAQKAAEAAAQETGARTLGLKCRVEDIEDVRKLFADVISEFGTIDILFNNAGIANVADALVNLDPSDIRHHVDVNVNGVIYCCQEAAKIMLKKGSGSIINMCSMSAHIYNVPQKATYYAATKGAVLSFTRSLACELAPGGVRVNCISPGYHMTEMAKQWTDCHPVWLERIPMGRFADPYELSGTVIYLASSASSYVTGAEIVVDGGYTLY
ncbi:glucose 1-dehydrogenase [Clostridiaceae bacterium]|nr:glucose 1-dehydrogenase [Clostridiaceae bacterium]